MNTKIKTLTVKLSDAEIGRNAKLEHVRDLRDAGHPALHFRFSKNRTRGSWYLVNKRRWHRIGAFPALSAKQVLAELPAVRLRVSADAGSTISQWATIGELLTWYADRMARDRSLSAKRKNTGASAMKCHLLPRLGNLPLVEVNKATLDTLFMWPLQEALSIDYVRLAFQLLALAFRQALKLGLITSNPMAGTINKTDVSRYSFRLGDRSTHKAVSTKYQDKATGKLAVVNLNNDDAPDGLPPVHTDRHIHPNKTAAEQAAKARLAAFNRSTAGVRLEMPGRSDLFAERMINAQGFKDGLDGEYLVDSKEQVFTQSGWSTTIECNAGKKGKAKAKGKKPAKTLKIIQL